MIISVDVAETNGSTPSLSSLFAVPSTRINIPKFHEIRRSKQRFVKQTSHTMITWSSYVHKGQTIVNIRFQWMYFIIFLRPCSICSTSRQDSFLTKISWPSLLVLFNDEALQVHVLSSITCMSGNFLTPYQNINQINASHSSLPTTFLPVIVLTFRFCLQFVV